MSNPLEAMVGSRYLELVTQFPLRPIRSDTELNRAIAMTHALIGIGARQSDEDDYLQVLGDLIHQYEQEAYPIPRATDAELLQHLIEARDVTPTEVAASTAIAEATIKLILSGHRAISPNDATALSRYFHVSLETFCV